MATFQKTGATTSPPTALMLSVSFVASAAAFSLDAINSFDVGISLYSLAAATKSVDMIDSGFTGAGITLASNQIADARSATEKIGPGSVRVPK
jgi:hypothetical protein